MNSNKLLVAFTIAVCLVVLIGEAYAYLPSDYGYGSSANLDTEDGIIGYDIWDSGSSEYSAILIDNEGYTAVESVIIYYDPGLESMVNEDVAVEVGAQKMTQKYYIDQLVKVLEYRGVKDVSILNADELAEALRGDLDSEAAAGRGLVFASGVMPYTVFSGNEDDLIVQWIDSGGSLYWVGNVIGKYVATESGIIEVNATSVFTGTESVNMDNSSAYDDVSETRKMFSYEYNRTMYSIDVTDTDRRTLCAGYTDGKYASTTFIEMGEGQVCIVGGEFNSKQIRDLAISICSGLSYASTFIGYEDSIVSGHAHGSFDVSDVSGNIRLYLYIGGYFCVYGQGYDFCMTQDSNN